MPTFESIHQHILGQQFMVWLVMFTVVRQAPLLYLWMACSTIACQSIPAFMLVPFHTPVDEQGVSTLSASCRLGVLHRFRWQKESWTAVEDYV
jgi:hypothetical protein